MFKALSKVRKLNSVLRDNVRLLILATSWMEKKYRIRLYQTLFLQCVLALLDFGAIILVGLIGSYSVNFVQNKGTFEDNFGIIEFFSLDNLLPELQLLVLGIVATLILIFRTFFSLIATRKIVGFFSFRSADLSIAMFRRLLLPPFQIVKDRNSQELLFSLTRGCDFLMIQLFSTVVVLVGDISILVLLTVGLVFYDPLTALAIVSLFLFISLVLSKLILVKTSSYGELNTQLNIDGNKAILESILTYKESYVSGLLDYHLRKIAESRFALARVGSFINYAPYVAKYILESSIVVGAILVGSLQLVLNDIPRAVSAIAVFLVSGTRIVPAVLRIQQGLLNIKSGKGMSKLTVELMREMEVIHQIDDSPVGTLGEQSEGFLPVIRVNKLTFGYTNPSKVILHEATFKVMPGEFVGIVGPSGVGKSTLIELILGLKTPNSGNISVCGLEPKHAISKWPGEISYVPQSPFMKDADVRENILKGRTSDFLSNYEISKLFKRVIQPIVSSDSKLTLDTQVGEYGCKISGGQRQLIDIARALVSHPKLIILDEAMVSLDKESQAYVKTLINELKNSTTVILVTHDIEMLEFSDFIINIQKEANLEITTYQEYLNSYIQKNTSAN